MLRSIKEFSDTPKMEIKGSSLNLVNLPDDILTEIVKEAIVFPSDANNLSLVCRKFHEISDSDQVWKIFAEPIGLIKIGASYKNSYRLMKNEKTEAKKLIAQIENPSKKAQALLELIKACPDDNDAEKTEAKLLVDQISFTVMKYPLQLELVKAYLKENKKTEAKELISKIEDPAYKAQGLLELVKAYPDDDKEKIEVQQLEDQLDALSLPGQLGIVKAYLKKKQKIEAKKFISQIKDSYYETILQIELVKAFPDDDDEKTKAKKLISQIREDPFSFKKCAAQLKLVKAYLKENKKTEAKELISQIEDPFSKARNQMELISVRLIYQIKRLSYKTQAQLELVKAYPDDNEEKIKAKHFISQIEDPSYKARAQLELVKAYPNHDEEKIKAKLLISQIQETFEKAEAQIKLISTFFLDFKVKKHSKKRKRIIN